jgi:predicted ribosome quality control (RQC) complex YloA/Tae2 family protein
MDSGPARFSPLHLHHLKNVQRRENFDTINQAWITFISTHGQKKEGDKQWQEIRNVLKKRVSYLERTLDKISDAEKLEQRKKESELKGHLLQTFAHEIPKGQNKVTLPNIFSATQEKVEIKLNPAKTIHENAQKYYSKFKNIEEQRENLIVKKDTFEHELTECHVLLRRAQKQPSPKEINNLYTKLIDMNLIQAQGVKQVDRDNLAYSFNRLVLGKKWEIYIGKNAANNDLLTFKFSRKYDLWLHAQGVPGSHVVIRKPDRTQNPPQKIIEQAASIAAFNSDAKHATTVPVNITEVRYVRKPRKSPPGTVTIANAKTLFVKPVQLG